MQQVKTVKASSGDLGGRLGPVDIVERHYLPHPGGVLAQHASLAGREVNEAIFVLPHHARRDAQDRRHGGLGEPEALANCGQIAHGPNNSLANGDVSRAKLIFFFCSFAI